MDRTQGTGGRLEPCSSRTASVAIFPSPMVPTTRSRGSRPSGCVLSAHRPCRTIRSFCSRRCESARTRSRIDSATGPHHPPGRDVDGNAMFSAGLEIDIVVPHAAAPDRAQPRHSFERRRCDPRLERNQHVVVGESAPAHTRRDTRAENRTRAQERHRAATIRYRETRARRRPAGNPRRSRRGTRLAAAWRKHSCLAFQHHDPILKDGDLGNLP